MRFNQFTFFFGIWALTLVGRGPDQNLKWLCNKAKSEKEATKRLRTTKLKHPGLKRQKSWSKAN